MREIKFRFWNRSNLEMLSPKDICHLTGEMSKDLEKTYLIPMQYTGLKDKNGKGIYEGDIVRFKQPYNIDDLPNDFIEFTAPIIFWRSSFCMDSLEYNQWELRSIDSDDEIEVIGNIYENPELLEVK